MAPGQDILVQEMLTETERKIDDMVAMFRALFQAEPTDAHRVLKALYDAGHAVGPLATHNFDRLFARTGIPEAFMRHRALRSDPRPAPPGRAAAGRVLTARRATVHRSTARSASPQTSGRCG
ncbi:hypothetical protein ACFP3U_00460 [Kitasatospora misakiensis]|uniref:Deacetylase sirtuin-type domain-containing protein n=1 Tax=Kitasatospora misakiensis TaxID=67330 RepID=A0ABW0WUX3_9ACTN